FGAFGPVAALTVLASGTALLSYSGLARSLAVVTGTSLPQVTRASKVAKAAGEVAAAAPALQAAASPTERARARGGCNPGGGRSQAQAPRAAHAAHPRPSQEIGRKAGGDCGLAPRARR